MTKTLAALALTLLIPVANAAPTLISELPEAQAFAGDFARRHDFDAATLLDQFSRIKVNDSVISLMEPPTTPGQRSWQRYRSRFVNAQRIDGGVEFWTTHALPLARAQALYGVPEEIIVAIIGVETIYGRITGGFSVYEALATLAFQYPRRADFFRGELEQFLLLTRENGLDPLAVRGSYAGAIGIPQFMPGSERRYAVDFDRDGHIDLSASVDDAIGSVARFLEQHGWQPGQPVAVPANLPGPPDEALLAAGIRPSLSVASLFEQGILAEADPAATVTLVDLETPDAPTEYWLGFNNFYVITRYNRSSFYAMSVFQLAREIRQAMTLADPGKILPEAR